MGHDQDRQAVPWRSRPGDPEAFTAAMMKGGGRLQAMSFHYYTIADDRGPGDTSVNWRGPATGFFGERCQWATS